MPGIKDVARRAGVGVATVSRVINNSGYVSEETKDKIEKAMKELDYMPNELARNLFRNKSGSEASFCFCVSTLSTRSKDVLTSFFFSCHTKLPVNPA